MTKNNNFMWLANDIDSTLILKVNRDDGKCDIYNFLDVLETPCDKLEVDNGNINDLTNLLTLGVVRFCNMANSSDIIDIPFRNLYLLYKNGEGFGNVPFSIYDSLLSDYENLEFKKGKKMSFRELDIFSVIDGEVVTDFFLSSFLVCDVAKDLTSLMEIAYRYGKYDMQRKFDALKVVNDINKNRLLEQMENKHLK